MMFMITVVIKVILIAKIMVMIVIWVMILAERIMIVTLNIETRLLTSLNMLALSELTKTRWQNINK